MRAAIIAALFFIPIMKFIFIPILFFNLLLAICPQSSFGQGSQEATKKVLDILSKKEVAIMEFDKLKLGAWEALSYLEERQVQFVEEDLLEAVPDYYNFSDSTVIIKLVNPNDYNDYGIQLELRYEIKGKELILFDKKGKEKDRWTFLYLDNNYLALDMGQLRVFFTKTPIQE